MPGAAFISPEVSRRDSKHVWGTDWAWRKETYEESIIGPESKVVYEYLIRVSWLLRGEIATEMKEVGKLDEVRWIEENSDDMLGRTFLSIASDLGN